MLPAEIGTSVRPSETNDETFKLWSRTGEISINRYWWAMHDGTREVRFDAYSEARAGINVCQNLTSDQVRELRDELTRLLRLRGARD